MATPPPGPSGALTAPTPEPILVEKQTLGGLLYALNVLDVQDVAGGRTGLIVHNVKGVGKGDDFKLIDVYEVDTSLLKEMREHEKQAAIEVGQWQEKVQHDFTEGFVQALKEFGRATGA